MNPSKLIVFVEMFCLFYFVERSAKLDPDEHVYPRAQGKRSPSVANHRELSSSKTYNKSGSTKS